MGYFELVSSLVIGITFLISGLSKVFSLKSTINIVVQTEMLPQYLSKLFGFILPFLEIILSLNILFTGFFRIATTSIFFILLLLFIFANIKAIVEKKDLACNCFGGLFSSKFGPGALMHCVILLLLCLPTFFGFYSYKLNEFLTIANFHEILFLFWSVLLLFAAGLVTRLLDYT